MARLAIGLDVGPRMVRAIAIAPPSRAERLEGKVGRIVATAAVTRISTDGAVKPLPAALAEAQEVLGMRGQTTVHLGDAKVLFRYLATLPLSADRTAKVLRLELASHAAEDGDLAADAWPVNLPGDEHLHGCALAVPTDLYAGMVDLAEAGWRRTRISTGPVAAFNATLPTSPARGEAIHLLIDIGPQVTSLTLFGEDRLLACRTIGMGTDAFAEALQQDGRGTIVRAISRPPPKPAPVLADSSGDLELDLTAPLELAAPTPVASAPAVPTATSSLSLEDDVFQLEDTPSAPAPAPATALPAAALELDDAPGTATTLNLLDEAPLPAAGAATIAQATADLGPEALRVAEQLASQIASSVLWFRQQLRLTSITLGAVHLSGDGAAIPGLDRYLARRFTCPATVFQPAELLAGTVPADAPAWTTAIGLALADPQRRGAVVLDLRPESLVIRDAYRRHVVWPLVAAGLLVLAAIPAGVTCWRLQDAHEATLAAWNAYLADHQKLSTDLAAVEKERKALESDLRAISGRVASGENLLLAVRALKEQAPRSKELWVTRMTTERLVAEDDGTARGPTKLGAGGLPVVADTAIDRGALIIDAQVRFDAAATGGEQDQFRQSYQEALLNWRPRTDAQPLFSAGRVENFVADAQATGAGKTAGTFIKFTLRYTFRPTDLSEITINRRGER